MKPVLVPGKDPAGPAGEAVACSNHCRAAVDDAHDRHRRHRARPGRHGAVSAKTGTAEVVSNGKVITNGWMVGYRDDVAFAVIVEGGASGAKAAGPICQTSSPSSSNPPVHRLLRPGVGGSADEEVRGDVLSVPGSRVGP